MANVLQKHSEQAGQGSWQERKQFYPWAPYRRNWIWQNVYPDESIYYELIESS